MFVLRFPLSRAGGVCARLVFTGSLEHDPRRRTCVQASGVRRCPMPRFTPAAARQMAARSAEFRRLNPLKAVPPAFKLVPADYPEHVPASDDYHPVVLARTRTQLDLVGRQITTEFEREKLDSRRLRDLSDAQAKLAEQERILGNRPLPGSLKPTSVRRPAHPGLVGPLGLSSACGVTPAGRPG